MNISIILVLTLISFPLFAQNCQQVTPISWPLKQVEETHPQLLIKRLELNQLQAGEHEAKKSSILNPRPFI